MNIEMNPTPSVGSKERLAADLKQVATDTSGLVKEFSAATASDIAQVKTMVEQSFYDAKAYAISGRVALSDKVRGAAIATDGYVREHPWRTLGGTALAGLVIGFLFSRR
ncbi:hypothetical protein OPU71_05615 [Niveibacterium sp. 24ML]|uniref:DUF883 family protein n=1 Tax=Niveibacterium sp. 24ML TaxID=2985512 RepID=UPI0022703208|nr:hypothetical protein [Niveibacterium sp. 24ML]MCX9155599.1 hypothetical protein [Niveibacterium sp. 24ML]